MVKISLLSTKASRPVSGDKFVLNDSAAANETKNIDWDYIDQIDDAATDTDTTWSSDKINTQLGTKAASSHDHDDRYYTDTETDALLANKAASTHTHVVADITDFSSVAKAADVNDETDVAGYVAPDQLDLYTGYTVAVSDVLLQSANTERTTTSSTYVKVKEIVATVAGTYRVTREGRVLTASGGYRRIYKNGVAFGTEINNTSTSYHTESQDLTFAEGDLIQLYHRNNASASTTYSKNFRLLGSIKPVSITLTVNTD